MALLTPGNETANLKGHSMTTGERNAVRVELDCLPDFIVAGKEIGFRKEFRTLASEDSFCDVHNFFSHPACTLRCLIDVGSVLLH